MSESDSGSRRPEVSIPSGGSGNVAKIDLVARMHEKRAEFAEFRFQYAQFRRGYNARLYEFLQFIYAMVDAFLLDLDELRRFKTDEFFDCNRQKPDETNLPWHLLYFLTDARTDADRDKWLKPAAVVNRFRSLGVPANEVAQRVKDGGGYNRIYKGLPGKRAASEPSDDLDVLLHGSVEADNHVPEILESPATTAEPSDTADDNFAASPAEPSAAPVQDSIDATPGSFTVGSDYQLDATSVPRTAASSDNVLSSESDTQKRISRTRVNLKTTVPVVAPPSDPNSMFPPVTVESIIKPNLGLILYKVEPSGVDDFRIVTALHAEAIEDETTSLWDLIHAIRTGVREASKRSAISEAAAQRVPPVARPSADDRRLEQGSSALPHVELPRNIPAGPEVNNAASPASVRHVAQGLSAAARNSRPPVVPEPLASATPTRPAQIGPSTSKSSTAELVAGKHMIRSGVVPAAKTSDAKPLKR